MEEEERERLTNLFEFGDATAAEVMVPRTQMIALNAKDTIKHFLEELSSSGHSRYPVIDDSLDEVRGIIYFKDVAEALSTEKLDFNNLVDPWVTPPQFIPETMVLSDVLEAMKNTNQAMLIVVDEYGGTAGLITIQDLINEILGEHHDVDHASEQDWQRLNDGTILVQAQMPLDEVNDLLNSDFPVTDDYHTLAGFMIHHLQTIPDLGAVFRYKRWELVLVDAEDNRLHTIRVRSLPKQQLNSTASTSKDASSLPTTSRPLDSSVSNIRVTSEDSADSNCLQNGSESQPPAESDAAKARWKMQNKQIQTSSSDIDPAEVDSFMG